MAEPLPDTLLVDLLARMLADRTEAGLRPLEAYQAAFPGHDAAVEAEWRRMQSPGEAPAADGRRVGPYHLVRELGRGGQGAVWLALDERLQRHVALKIVPRSPLVEDLAPRFRREAELAGRLDHPGLCPVYDVGHDESVAWIALRYVEGETLAHRLARGPLPREEALLVVERAARALHVAHEAGVVHRDVKPGNLMLTPAGQVVVLDFGVARPQEDGPPLTLTGEALGTPAYMAPEALGRGHADQRADIWALGVTLHEALAGRRPFEAATREGLVRAILQDDPAPLPGAGRDLRVVLATALAREPDRRYRTAADLAEDLRRLRTSEPVRARPLGPLARLLLWRRRRPALAASLAALALVLVAGLVVTAVLLADTRRSLAEVRRLSDHKLTRDLVAEADTLWPAVPERAPALQRWLDGAEAVLGRAPLHSQALAEAGGLCAWEQVPADAPAADVERAWLRESLAEMLVELDGLSAVAADVRRRLDFARSVERLSLEEPREAWRAAAAAVAADARFAGLALRPQLGLVPLGADPDSGLQEFAVLATGRVPARDAAGRLAADDDGAAVLVLVPGGRTTVGASPETDPWCQAWDGPPQTVTLDPFFVGKHELTQGQWSAHAGANPSTYSRPQTLRPGDRPARHPVESMTCEEATRVLAQMGLALPTEVQWEHAARAGTTTPWWCGAEPASLQGCANLADRFAAENGGLAAWTYSREIDDGGLLHAPVGAYRANAFGLHDVHGNVAEWTASTWEDWSKFHPRDGDGACPGEETTWVIRGGTYSNAAPEVRSSLRTGEPPGFHSFMMGLRVARALER